jgi:IclR family transcriptional regulator, mhp operon transcriptional activator
MASSDNLSSLKRGLRALSLLNLREVITATELAAELRLPRTTARRVLDTLVEEGYAEKMTHEHKYRLTPMVNVLSSGFSDESWIAHVAEPLLVRKTIDIGWPLVVATPSGDQMMVRVSTDRLTPLALDHFGVGFKTPMVHGTSGHVMLAFMSQQHRELTLQVIRSSSDPKQALAREDARIRSMVNAVRAQGFAHIIYKEYPEASVGVPIFLNGVARACLLMGYVKAAIKPAQINEKYVPQLKSLSEAITAGVAELRLRRRETHRATTKKRPEQRDSG